MIPQRKLRRRARNRLDSLLYRQGHKCHWCGRWLVRLQTLDDCDIIKLTAHMVTWRDGDDILIAHIATSDHLKELSAGGDSHIRNLVASCLTCNNKRSRQGKKGREHDRTGN